MPLLSGTALCYLCPQTNASRTAVPGCFTVHVSARSDAPCKPLACPQLAPKPPIRLDLLPAMNSMRTAGFWGTKREEMRSVSVCMPKSTVAGQTAYMYAQGERG